MATILQCVHDRVAADNRSCSEFVQQPPKEMSQCEWKRLIAKDGEVKIGIVLERIYRHDEITLQVGEQFKTFIVLNDITEYSQLEYIVCWGSTKSLLQLQIFLFCSQMSSLYGCSEARLAFNLITCVSVRNLEFPVPFLLLGFNRAIDKQLYTFFLDVTREPYKEQFFDAVSGAAIISDEDIIKLMTHNMHAHNACIPIKWAPLLAYGFIRQYVSATYFAIQDMAPIILCFFYFNNRSVCKDIKNVRISANNNEILNNMLKQVVARAKTKIYMSTSLQQECCVYEEMDENSDLEKQELEKRQQFKTKISQERKDRFDAVMKKLKQDEKTKAEQREKYNNDLAKSTE